ncbi:ribose 5-phosphate isomerase A [Candidatus Bathyarchaeota archaeon]|nr:MAG: ribose 5-phosphate isomerase A [Candidatus Bathyarchaeota archaeon]
MKSLSNWREDAKKRAAEAAIGNVKDGWVIGLGSGTTVEYAVSALGKRVREEGLKVYIVPSSYQIFYKALEEKLPIVTLDEYPCLELTIDGADEVDKNLNLVKGGGGALTREKIIGYASKRYVIIVDETKLVDNLGSKNPIPAEVLPFALPIVLKELKKSFNVKVREGRGKVGPTVTDNGNFIVDIYCGIVKNPEAFNSKLKSIPGIIETGLFLNMANLVYVGRKDGKIDILSKS